MLRWFGRGLGRLATLAAALTAAVAVSLLQVQATPADAASFGGQAPSLAVDDVSEGNPVGAIVVVDVLANDDPSLVADSVRMVPPGRGPSTGRDVADFIVEGEGWWWAVTAVTGGPVMVEFEPEPGLVGNPTPQQYSVLDSEGNEFFATVTITYEQGATTTSTAAPPVTTTPDAPASELPATGPATDIAISLALLFVASGWLIVRRTPSRNRVSPPA